MLFFYMNTETPDPSYHQYAVILFADMAGYTALMQQNEQMVLAMLKQYKQIIYEKSTQFSGEVVQDYGDGCMLLFGSAADGVRCALALQRAFRAQRPELAVRIGIHQGEVVRDESHVYGDSVNITSHIESMGIPGAVLLSREVQTDILSLPDLPCESLGVFALRHVETPIEVFALTHADLTVPTTDQMLGKAYPIDNSSVRPNNQSAPIQILIVEDDMIVGAHISLVLAEAGYGVLGLIPTGEAALEQIRVHPPDLVLMDIQLKGNLDGVDTAAEIYQNFQIPVIFLTANSDAATFARAKATFPYAFIDKPFRPSALLRAVELVVQRIHETQTSDPPAAQEQRQGTPKPLSDLVFVRDKDRMVKVKLSDIRYVAAERNYCRIHTSDRQYLLSSPMKSLEPQLGEHFVRTHRSFVVNINAIDSFDEFYLYLNKDAIPLGKSYKEDVLNRLNRV